MPAATRLRSASRPAPAAPPPGRLDICLFRREGEYWAVLYADQVVRIRDTVGVRHLAQLLWHPQREFYALDLMRALALSGDSRGGARAAKMASPNIDKQAALAYQQRVRSLERELADAEGMNDVGRVDGLRGEIDTILHELRASAHGRWLREDAERARVAVTKSIKAVLGRIRAVHEVLADHLDASVKRGYVCVYRPDPRCPIRWDC